MASWTGEFLVAIMFVEDPEHDCDYHKYHPTRFRAQRPACQPLRSIPSRFEQVADGIFSRILSRPQKEVSEVKGGVKTNRECERSSAARPKRSSLNLHGVRGLDNRHVSRTSSIAWLNAPMSSVRTT